MEEGQEPEVGRPRADDEDPRQSRAFLDSIVEHLPNMVFVKDAAELRFVRFNRAGEELIGYSREDMVGKNDYDLFPPEEADFFTAKDRQVLAGRDVVDIPAEPIETRFHGQRILHTQKIPILGDDGEPAFLLGISEDITEKVQAAEALRERQETLTAIFEASPDAIVVLTPDLVIREASAAIERIDGFSARDRADRGWPDLVHPDDADLVAEAFAALMGTEVPTVEIRYRTRHADGHWVPVEARGRRLHDGDGQASGAVVVVRDISERIQAEEALSSERATVEMLQRAFVPTLPTFPDVQIAGTYRPAGHEALVGGDWYDAFPLPDGAIGLVVGDVAGHGVSAGALMAQLRNGARALASIGLGPAATLDALNEVLRRFAPGEMATAIVGHLDPVARHVTWASAGHPPLLFAGGDGVSVTPGPDGPPLGAIEGIAYGEQSRAFEAGTHLFLYTDGLIERRGETLREGLLRLVGVVKDAVVDPVSVGELPAALCAALLTDGPQHDDVCVLALHCPPDAVEATGPVRPRVVHAD